MGIKFMRRFDSGQVVLGILLLFVMSASIIFCLASARLFQPAEFGAPPIVREWATGCVLSPTINGGAPMVVFHAHCYQTIAFVASTVTVNTHDYSQSYDLTALKDAYYSPPIPINEFDNNAQPTLIALTYYDLADAGSKTTGMFTKTTTFYYTADKKHVLAASFDNRFLLNVIRYAENVRSINWKLYLATYLFTILGCGLLMAIYKDQMNGPPIFIFGVFVLLPLIRFWIAWRVTGENTPNPFENVLGGGDAVGASAFFSLVSLIFVVPLSMAVANFFRFIIRPR
jgi:hypothetical protein